MINRINSSWYKLRWTFTTTLLNLQLICINCIFPFDKLVKYSVTLIWETYPRTIWSSVWSHNSTLGLLATVMTAFGYLEFNDRNIGLNVQVLQHGSNFQQPGFISAKFSMLSWLHFKIQFICSIYKDTGGRRPVTHIRKYLDEIWSAFMTTPPIIHNDCVQGTNCLYKGIRKEAWQHLYLGCLNFCFIKCQEEFWRALMPMSPIQCPRTDCTQGMSCDMNEARIPYRRRWHLALSSQQRDKILLKLVRSRKDYRVFSFVSIYWCESWSMMHRHTTTSCAWESRGTKISFKAR